MLTLLTRKQIEALTDAEASKYLAEKVMGWTFSYGTWWTGDISRTSSYAAQFATDLNQAVEAAGKMGLELEGLTFGLVWNLGTKKWMAGWGAVVDWMSHSAPARAICNAVIAAHEAKHA